MNFKVVKIVKYEFDRDVVLKSEQNGRVITAFDDSSGKFAFMEIGKIYDCKIESLGDITKKQPDKGINHYVIKQEKEIGALMWWQVQADDGTEFYLRDSGINASTTDFNQDVWRYNLLQVDDVVDDRLLPGGELYDLVKLDESGDSYDSADFIDDDMW